ncbi:uncharacterized protein B0I36DRAFT_366869 [Microdochium trichocladiopsis]|uniref:D-xylose 1-dehydrogenase (NADP(+), D-xylono-1,5-lactone-forming) n=1 Tax=Microdochium trichocladiopsis TaxID=1682393 RepID=A0A9P9BPX2_9PEZI|nr:uncharacterized protein B0I36DRAFT_366869 [Microdochium trichocladiopsis]KAH7024971.1 hypothetical protein B0I36DRAFT_366869 [Microdochium trichocladiopsis]
MASIVGFLSRNWQFFSPPTVPKGPQPLRFGVISAANIVPMAFLSPASTHPEVVVTAVAARDPARAAAFAKKHKIPNVKESYQALLDDPDIDCVYIPLPNGLHYEWAVRALRAGKHVYLEKPAVSNAIEAEKLFNSPLLKDPGAPVLLEAAHSWFYPAWSRFMSFVDPAGIERATSNMLVPTGFIADSDIRYDYALAGGAMMDTGPYTMGALRLAFGGGVPVSCEKAEWKPLPGVDRAKAEVDAAYEVHFRFANGGLGIARGTLKMPLSEWEMPNRIEVVHKPRVMVAGAGAVGDEAEELRKAGVSVKDGQEVVRVRTVSLSFFVMPYVYHTVHVQDEYTLRETGPAGGGKTVKKWTKKADHKAYSWKGAGVDQPGEVYWLTYRHCLEQFINKVRGRETKQWFGAEDSIATAKMLDMAYEAAGLKLRPTSTYE